MKHTKLIDYISPFLQWIKTQELSAEDMIDRIDAFMILYHFEAVHDNYDESGRRSAIHKVINKLAAFSITANAFGLKVDFEIAGQLKGIAARFADLGTLSSQPEVPIGDDCEILNGACEEVMQLIEDQKVDKRNLIYLNDLKQIAWDSYSVGYSVASLFGPALGKIVSHDQFLIEWTTSLYSKLVGCLQDQGYVIGGQDYDVAGDVHKIRASIKVVDPNFDEVSSSIASTGTLTANTTNDDYEERDVDAQEAIDSVG